MFAFLGAGIGVAYHVVSALAQMLTPLAGGLATAAAIVAFTLSVRLLLVPLSYYALRGQARQARLLPQMRELQQRHARNPEKLQRELAALREREGAGVLAGCLPLLLQLPFFGVMYRLFLSRAVNGTPNGLLGHTLLGAPLGAHWLSGPGPLSRQGLVFAGLFLLMAGAGWASARLARSLQAEQAAAPPAPAATRFVIRVLPFSTLMIAAFVPLAAGLYLLTTTAWTVAERRLLRRRLARAGEPQSRRRGGPAAGRSLGSSA
ncbi:MAG: membrane protein insertase YidC [Streptosporangiaceae bacterium]|jgi:YidC/Oxa1 family membrane protein insertase